MQTAWISVSHPDSSCLTLGQHLTNFLALHTTSQWWFHPGAWCHRSIRSLICKSEAVGAQVSLPWRRAERTKASNTFPRAVRDMCLDVRIGRSFLNFPQAVQHLVIMAREQPPPDPDIIKTNILSTFEKYWVKTVATRMLTRFYKDLTKWPTFLLYPPMFELDPDIINTNILIKFE